MGQFRCFLDNIKLFKTDCKANYRIRYLMFSLVDVKTTHHCITLRFLFAQVKI